MSGFLGMLFPGPSGGGGGGPSEYIGFGNNSGGFNAYPWNNSTGFGSRYAQPTPVFVPLQVSFVPDNSNISASLAGSPYFYVWQWSSLGFGTLYSNPASLLNPATGGIAGYTWTPSIDAFLAINYTAPTYPQAWAWTPSAGFGTKYANGSLLSSSAGCRAISLNGDGTLAATLTFTNLPNSTIAIYPWSSSTGFGTRFANPTTLPDAPSANPLTISFNRVTNDLIVAKNTSNFVTAYPVTSSGFGTKYADPSTSFGGTPNGLRFSPDGSAIATANNSSPPVIAFSWGAGFGTKYANPASPPSYAISMDWENTNAAIAFGNRTFGPFGEVFRWSSAGFGAKYSSPTTAVNSTQALSFSNQSR